MFYGINKNKNGKEISNYDRYLPWEEGEFSGKISYRLDNEEEYEIYRKFNQKNPQIFDKNANDVSKEFTIDKQEGNKYFYEQTKVDEELLTMSMVIHQQEVALDAKSKNTLIQKASNIMLTGEDSISYKNIINKLNKRQTEDIGTLKSPTKPLYLAKKQYEELTQEKNALENVTDDKYAIEEEIKQKQKELRQEEELLKALQEMNEVENTKKVEEEKIKVFTASKNELEKNKSELKQQIEGIEPEEEENKKYNLLYIIPVLMIVASIVLLIINQLALGAGGIILSIVVFLAILLNRLKEAKKHTSRENEKREQKRNLETKIQLIEEEIKNKEKLINDIKQNIEIKLRMKKEEIKLKYPEVSKTVFDSVENGLNLSREQNYINDLKLAISKKELEKKQIISNVENLVEIEEKLKGTEEILEELIKYNDEINIAKEALETAYTEMKESITPKFTENLSKSIRNITGEKYKTVKVNEENDLVLETENRKLYRCKSIKPRYNR